MIEFDRPVAPSLEQQKAAGIDTELDRLECDLELNRISLGYRGFLEIAHGLVSDMGDRYPRTSQQVIGEGRGRYPAIDEVTGDITGETITGDHIQLRGQHQGFEIITPTKPDERHTIMHRICLGPTAANIPGSWWVKDGFKYGYLHRRHASLVTASEVSDLFKPPLPEDGPEREYELARRFQLLHEHSAGLGKLVEDDRFKDLDKRDRHSTVSCLVDLAEKEGSLMGLELGVLAATAFLKQARPGKWRNVPLSGEHVQGRCLGVAVPELQSLYSRPMCRQFGKMGWLASLHLVLDPDAETIVKLAEHYHETGQIHRPFLYIPLSHQDVRVELY